METNPKDTIQKLKEAGDELKGNKDSPLEEKVNPDSLGVSGQADPEPKDGTNFLNELRKEKLRLERVHQKTKEQEKKLIEKIELLNKLQKMYE